MCAWKSRVASVTKDRPSLKHVCFFVVTSTGHVAQGIIP